jgi:hypothetical protein
MKNIVFFMSISDKNYFSSLTADDWLVISRIIIGCSKLVYDSYRYLDNNNSRQKRLFKTSKKQVAFLSSFANLREMAEVNPIFRPSDIRRKLPEDVQNIQWSDLSRMFKILERYSVITKTGKNVRRRGAPSKKSNDLPEEPGPKSYYQTTVHFEKLKKVLDKPEARKLIFSLLMESKLIYRYWKVKALSYLYVLKFGGKDKQREIKKAVGIVSDEANLENLYNIILSLDYKELEVMA